MMAQGLNLEEGDSYLNYLVDPVDWNKDSNLRHCMQEIYELPLENVGDGLWTGSLDLPGGSYTYRYAYYKSSLQKRKAYRRKYLYAFLLQFIPANVL